MSLLFVSVIAGLSFGVFFWVISLISKREDYLLDDYTEDDAPANVRIIEREIPKYIEKEVIKEIEKVIVDTDEVDRLSKIKEDITKQLEHKEQDLEIKHKELSEKETIVKEMEDKLSSISSEKTTLEVKEKELSEKLSSLSNELVQTETNYKEKLEKEISEKELVKQEQSEILTKKEAEINKAVNNIKILKEEVDSVKNKLKEVDKNRKEYQTLFKKTKKDLDVNKSDTEHFAKVLDKKDEEINKLKTQLDNISIKTSTLYEGVDDYGKFYDVYSLPDKIPTERVHKIQDISEKLKSDEFAQYAINTSNSYENISTHPLSELPKYIKTINNIDSVNGKYNIFIIIDNRVYIHEVY